MAQGVDFDNMSHGEQMALETFLPMIENDIAEDKLISNTLEDMGKVLRTSKFKIEIKDSKMCVVRDKIAEQILEGMNKQIDYQVKKIIGSYL